MAELSTPQTPHEPQVVEKPYRSILKTISWRVTGTLDTLVISYLLTGNLKIAGSIAGVEVVSKMILCYIHERAWEKLKIGRETVRPPDYEI